MYGEITYINGLNAACTPSIWLENLCPYYQNSNIIQTGSWRGFVDLEIKLLYRHGPKSRWQKPILERDKKFTKIIIKIFELYGLNFKLTYVPLWWFLNIHYQDPYVLGAITRALNIVVFLLIPSTCVLPSHHHQVHQQS